MPQSNGAWSYYSNTFTTSPTTTSIRLFILATSGSPTQGTTIDVDMIQLEKKAYSTSYTDSLRNAESLTIPTSGIDGSHGTVEFVVDIPDNATYSKGGTDAPTFFWFGESPGVSPSAPHQLFGDYNAGALRLAMYGETSDAYYVSGTCILTVGQHRLAFTWDGTDFKIYADGIPVITNVNVGGAGFCSVINAASIGYRAGNNAGRINTTIADFMVSNVVRSAADLLARGTPTPLTADENTVVYMPLNGNLSGADGRRTLRYTVIKPLMATESLKYTIPITKPTVIKSTRYAALAARPNITKSISYKVIDYMTAYVTTINVESCLNDRAEIESAIIDVVGVKPKLDSAMDPVVKLASLPSTDAKVDSGIINIVVLQSSVASVVNLKS
jgi:hypothetical protein